ncbi:MAG: hypothetical protein JWO95_3549 [Verrucomicrobiales bacterium]|nr:hypothetical protein [Verrucomicrobiales bacterium]
MLVQSSNNIALKTAGTADVVVSNLALHSKFFLQQAHSHHFFQGIERWTNDPDRALVFYDVQEALYICRWLGLSEVRIDSDLDQVDSAAALAHVA